MHFHRTTGLSPHQLDVLVSRIIRKIPDWDKQTGRPHAPPLREVRRRRDPTARWVTESDAAARRMSAQCAGLAVQLCAVRGGCAVCPALPVPCVHLAEVVGHLDEPFVHLVVDCLGAGGQHG